MNKKIKIIAFTIFIIVIIVLGYTIYSSATKEKEQSIEEKVLAENDYLEVKIINIANRMNNITIQNYKVTTKEVQKSSGSGDSTSASGESGQDSQSQGNGGSKEEGGSEQGNTGLGSSSNETTQEYSMEKINELSKEGTKEINWDDIQKEVEEIYTVVPTITLDLYQTSINQEDILKFNNYLDELAINSKNEDEKKTLENLCNMYECIRKFIENTSNEEEFKATIRAKENALIAYSRVSLEEWDKVEPDLQTAIDGFSVLLTNTNVNYKKQVNINKIYVILNELKNETSKKDKDVFFIKYKNLLEEMASM